MTKIDKTDLENIKLIVKESKINTVAKIKMYFIKAIINNLNIMCDLTAIKYVLLHNMSHSGRNSK